jgi:all-trans-retinol dehydrogenase (NAD+)
MELMKDVKDKIILITGGAGGIGRLMGLNFAERGAKVIAWDIKADALNTLEAEGREKGLFIRGMLCDVSDRFAVYRQAKALNAQFGPVDILINNAGIVSGASILDLSDEKIIRTMDVDVLPLFWTCKAFLPSMIERNSGHIVTIASAAGIVGVRKLIDYCAAKFAAFGFDESLRMELSQMKSAVRTTVVCPFFIDTGMFRGVKTRVPLFLPILKSEPTARKITAAILKNKKRLILPPFAAAVFFLRPLPAGVMDAIANLMGINHAMDEFKGRA